MKIIFFSEIKVFFHIKRFISYHGFSLSIVLFVSFQSTLFRVLTLQKKIEKTGQLFDIWMHLFVHTWQNNTVVFFENVETFWNKTFDGVQLTKEITLLPKTIVVDQILELKTLMKYTYKKEYVMNLCIAVASFNPLRTV